MPLPNRRSVVTTVSLSVVLAACSSSTTSPKGPSPQALATHFDSIYSALLAAGTEQDSTTADIIGVATVAPPAYGSPQASFTVNTGAGIATWKGYTIEFAETSANGDSEFATVAFSDNNLSQLIFVTADYDQNGYKGGDALALLNLTTRGDVITLRNSASLASTGSECPALQPGLASAAVIDTLVGTADCEHATFAISINASFTNIGALTLVSMSNATFDGVRFSEGAASRVAPIPSRIAALGLRLRNFRSAHTAR